MINTVPLLLAGADKVIKAIAVAIGGFWTYWNYKKSRPYAERLDLGLNGNVFIVQGETFVDINATIKNTSAPRQRLNQHGTYCELRAVYMGLSEELVSVFPVFQADQFVESGESIGERLPWHMPEANQKVVWFKVGLRVVSEEVEWNRQELIRLPEVSNWSTTLGL